MASTNPQAVVRHIDRNHVTIAPATGYSVVLFNLTDGNVEAIVAADDGSETIRLLVAGPEANQTMSIQTDKSGVVDIVYAETSDAR
jgi:hypothetical protein